MKKISIVILNFNSERDTLECIESISKINSSSFDLSIVIVDNGSNDKFKIHSLREVGNAKFKIEEIKIIRSEENLGFAEGNNLGIKFALKNGADYILLLNNDTLVDKNLIKNLLDTICSDPKIGIVVPKIYFAKGFEFHKERYKDKDRGKIIWYAGGQMDWNNIIGYHRGVDEVDRGQFDKTQETEFATGCCMLVKKEVFDKVGLFDNKYYLYYEDSDFNMRLRKTDYKIIFVPKALIWHKNANSSGGSGSSLQDYYITRNRLLFAIKYAPISSRASILKESLSLLIKGRPWQKKGILDFYLGKFGKGSFQK